MSAVLASPADSGTRVADRVPVDKVRALQHTLYRTAKADPGRRFHALWDKVLRRDVLWRGWVAVRANNGAPGIDRATLDWIEKEYGIDRLLAELSSELREGAYRPLPARRVYIPKPGTADKRPLSIPAVRDRIVQAATKIVLEPIFEADFLACSFGFRPRRSTHDALQVLTDETWRGRRWVVETDVADCFSAIPHDRLIQAVGERVVDQSVLKLLRAMLRAGVMESGVVRHPDTGTPQGGVISPLLCNVYLHRLDRAWDTRTFGGAGQVCRRSAGGVQIPAASPRRAGAAAGAAGRPRPGAERGQDPHRRNGGGRRGFRLSWLSPPDGALAGHPRQARYRVPGPLAQRSGDATCTRPDHRTDSSVPAVAAGRGSGQGPQQVPAGPGRATSATATPRPASTRSSSMRVFGSRCLSANGTNADAASAGLSLRTRRRTSAGC